MQEWGTLPAPFLPSPSLPRFPLLVHPGEMEKYDKIRVVGNGTFGKAWLIRSRNTGRQFVMKAISTDGFDAQSDARREADVHARLVHPNIVRCVLRSKHTPAAVLSCLPAHRPFCRPVLSPVCVCFSDRYGTCSLPPHLPSTSSFPRQDVIVSRGTHQPCRSPTCADMRRCRRPRTWSSSSWSEFRQQQQGLQRVPTRLQHVLALLQHVPRCVPTYL